MRTPPKTGGEYGDIKKSENLTFSLVVGIWRDLEFTNKLSSRCYIQNVSIFQLIPSIH